MIHRIYRQVTALPARLLTGFTMCAFVLLSGSAHSQDFGEAFSGFSTSSDDPIQIEADRLEVNDDEKVARYIGNVQVRQGESVLKTSELSVFYTGDSVGDVPGSGVQRIEATGRVAVLSKDQSATGNRAVFEMDKEIVTLMGDVLLTDGENILRGERLIVDLKTKKARVEGGGGSSSGRVQTILSPNSRPGAEGATSPNGN